ncbi:MAG TPA: FTR1 family protein [Dehalococcoidia bacterium]|nr:FTR1 family protein [Dehalococcoidia bacterium]
MLFSLLVTLREGLEIALVVTILLGYLRNVDQKRHFREIWLGTAAAAALSLGIGGALEVTSRELSGRVLGAFEGFTMLFAVAILTWMVFWMKRQSAGISRELRHRVDSALSGGSVIALALLAFSSVAREGIETALFLFAGSTSSGSGVQFALGGVAGFAIAAAAGIVLYYGAARLPLKQFFFVTGIAVVVLAAGMLANSFAALHEAALLTNLGSRPWDTESFIPMTSTMGKFLHTLLGYDSAPAVSQLAAYWSYLVIVLGVYVLMPAGTPPRAQAPRPESAAGVTAER